MKLRCVGSEWCYAQLERGSRLGGGGRHSERPNGDSAQSNSRSLRQQRGWLCRFQLAEHRGGCCPHAATSAFSHVWIIHRHSECSDADCNLHDQYHHVLFSFELSIKCLSFSSHFRFSSLHCISCIYLSGHTAFHSPTPPLHAFHSAFLKEPFLVQRSSLFPASLKIILWPALNCLKG